MTGRYLAVVGTPDRPIPDREAIAEGARTAGLEICHSDARLFVAVSPALAHHHLSEDRGMVIGEVFSRGTNLASSAESIGRMLAERPVDADRLVTRFWGNYVALLRAPGNFGITVLRAPFGKLPCLYGFEDGMTIAASDVAALAIAGVAMGNPDARALAERLAFPGLPGEGTCLTGIGNLPGGATLLIGPGGTSTGEAWSPWPHAERAQWYETTEQAQHEVRSAIYQALRALRGDAAKTLLMLSGGIDSSILAACLSSLGGEYRCVNFVHEDSFGDERNWARMVARHLGCQLEELDFPLNAVDVTRSESADLPSPGSRVFMQGTNAALASAADALGADLTLDGGGGDNVFLALNSVAPVTDALRHADTYETVWSCARTVAALGQASALEVLWRAARRRFRRSATFRWRPDLALLAPDAIANLASQAPHAWLSAPRNAEHGAAAHVAVIAAAQGWAEDCDLLSPVRHISPLASQPVVEACLRVPSWWWFRDGRSRIIARDAFADRLPREIVMRQSKGSPESFVADVYCKNRETVRSMLLDGQLRRLGLIDSDAVERATSDTGPIKDTAHRRLLQLSQVEAWLAAQHPQS
ncbi:asparagine synthase (glutamine-hydrolysing) [Novosphingobium sp. PhB165]|uniref:asparagine synthase-related protein n=1 Tax=Novosphingobium sp. PhB165 TaxID=2485105 RepID=UPI00104C922A|nr:asparagine synthetase B family protein [Novosphingobium sp. PhB165]TCM13011.1 asparagine synthase (glutamine-hydrolysing) [Novosphingobium sp. PhB165]